MGHDAVVQDVHDMSECPKYVSKLLAKLFEFSEIQVRRYKSKGC